MIREMAMGLACLVLGLAAEAVAVCLLVGMSGDPARFLMGGPAVVVAGAVAWLFIALGACWLAGMRFTPPRQIIPRVSVAPSSLIPPGGGRRAR